MIPPKESKTKIGRRDFLEIAGLATAAFGTGRTALGATEETSTQQEPKLAVSGASSAKLNVLFIMSDQHRYNASGYMGHKIVKTPSLDRLAENGMVFESAYCQYPLCVPSRMSMLTSRYPHILGVTSLQHALSQRELTIAEWFKQAGYVTAAIGKTHFVDERSYPDRGDRGIHGFDYMPRYDSAKFDGLIQERQGRGEPGQPPALEYLQSFARASDEPIEAHAEHITYRQTRDFLMENRNAPFFVMCSFFKPHIPYQPPEHFWNMYDPSAMPLPKSPPTELDDLSQIYKEKRRREGYDLLTPDIIQRWIAGYFGNVTFMDAMLGKVLDTLDELGLRETTVIVYTSDHGGLLGEHGLWEKTFFFEESARVPLIVSFPPRFSRGRRSATLVELTDLFPTLAEICGLEVPDSCMGKSLVPVLEDHSKQHKDAVLSQAYQFGPGRWPMPSWMLRTGRWKYIHYTEEPAELFDLEQDPGEFKNLGKSPDHDELLQKLEKQMLAHAMSSTGLNRPYKRT